MRLAVISDTHGLLRPEVRDVLGNASLIVHAGDVGSVEVLSALRAIAPLKVVRGNVDRGQWADGLPLYDAFECCGQHIYVRHIREELDLDPSAFDLLIVGHTHRPMLETYRGVLCLNPGSIGPRRFTLPISMAWVSIETDDEVPCGASPRIEFQRFDPM